MTLRPIHVAVLAVALAICSLQAPYTHIEQRFHPAAHFTFTSPTWLDDPQPPIGFIYGEDGEIKTETLLLTYRYNITQGDGIALRGQITSYVYLTTIYMSEEVLVFDSLWGAPKIILAAVFLVTTTALVGWDASAEKVKEKQAKRIISFIQGVALVFLGVAIAVTSYKSEYFIVALLPSLVISILGIANFFAALEDEKP